MAHVQNQSDLYLVEFKNTCQLVETDKMNSLQKQLQKSSHQGDLLSIKKVKSLAEQISVFDQLTFELITNSKILKSLVNETFKLDRESKEYIEAMNNISHFIHTNITLLVAQKVDELNSILEYEENRELN